MYQPENPNSTGISERTLCWIHSPAVGIAKLSTNPACPMGQPSGSARIQSLLLAGCHLLLLNHVHPGQLSNGLFERHRLSLTAKIL